VTIVRSSFPALGGEANGATAEEAMELARRVVEAEVRAIDETCSRFRADSELMALNSSGGLPFQASPLLIEALQAALRAARQTDGMVDPTVGGAMLRIGYDDDFERLPEQRPALPPEPRPVPGWRLVRLEPETRTVTIPPGTMLDLGATAKALAADRAALSAHQATGAGTLVSLAGDLSVAGPAPPGGWTILVAEDHRRGADEPGPRVSIQSGGLATSSRGVRRWRYGTAEHHHLVDPRTGLPSRSRWRTASVAAASCVDANTAATAAIIKSDSAEGWLRARGLPARLVSDDGQVLTLGGWPPEAAP
jgi:thiamine biosynthesis lipoprotein